MKALRRLFCRHEISTVVLDERRIVRRCSLCGHQSAGIEVGEPPAPRFEGVKDELVRIVGRVSPQEG
jgi:hypothetical protein